MTYRVEFAPAALRAFAKLDPETQRRLRPRIEALGENPRPSGAKAMQGADSGLLRIRIGDYRVVYIVKDDVLRVLVVKIGHRREVYRG